MSTPTMESSLRVAGVVIPDAGQLVRIYCGLPDAGGQRSHWAYAYFDAVDNDPDEVTPQDITACAALHARFSQPTFAASIRERGRLRAILTELPNDVDLAVADDALLGLVEAISIGLSDGVGTYGPALADAGRSLVTKVLHRKRPTLVPMFDKTIADRYSRNLSNRKEIRGPLFAKLLREDLCDNANRGHLKNIRADLEEQLPGQRVPSDLRVLDIAVWMDEHRDRILAAAGR